MLKLLGPQIKSLTRTVNELKRRVQVGELLGTSFSRPAVIPDAVPFLDPIDEICEEAPPRLMRSTHYAIVALFMTMLLIASVVKVDVVVTGTGRLTTDTPPAMLQGYDRAIIRELPVEPGDHVTKGQVVATLDPTFAKADFESMAAEQRSLSAQQQRLEAERDGKPFELGPTPTSEDQLQASLFAQRQTQYNSQLKVFDEDIARREAAIRTTQDDRDSLTKQLTVAKQVEDMRGALLQKEFGSKLNYLDAQSTRMRVEEQLQGDENKLGELHHDLESKQAERQGFIEQWRQKELDDLVSTRLDAAKASEGVAKASLINDLVVLTAPEDGVVLNRTQKSVGSVVSAAEPLITIVPSKSNLVADITINSSDVGYVRAGQDVVVKVDAFPYQRHGFLRGKLLYVAEESFSAAGSNGGSGSDVLPQPSRSASGAFHRGRVSLAGTELENMPKGARIIPGMTLTAEVKVGSRSVMSFFLNPLTRALNESVREP